MNQKHVDQFFEIMKDKEKMENSYEVPIIPREAPPEVYEELYRKGMIRKEDLKDGVTYYGDCRNSDIAVWHADKEQFTYTRHKWGSSYDEDISYPTDEQYYDVFVPLRVATKEDIDGD